MRELGKRALCGEHPFDKSPDLVALSFPGGDLGDQLLSLTDSPAEALAAQHTDLDLHHVEPARVLWRVVELQSAKDATGFRRWEGFVQRSGEVSRQIVHHHADQVCLWIGDINEVAHALGEITRGALVRHLHAAPRPTRIKADEQIDRAIATILII